MTDTTATAYARQKAAEVNAVKADQRARFIVQLADSGASTDEIAKWLGVGAQSVGVSKWRARKRVAELENAKAAI